MIKIENVEGSGWDTAVRGMRNPMNSWNKSDSYWTYIEDIDTKQRSKFEFFVGENDLKLMKSLSRAGSDHAKFMRVITVSFDATAPLYFWKEWDTYKVGTVSNSCSTMHKISEKEFTLDDFSHEHMIGWTLVSLEKTISLLNYYRVLFNETKDKTFWWQMIQLLPSSYNQRRTVTLNYAVLKNMYHARKDHKLDEWRDFCKWIETLPYSEIITIYRADSGDSGDRNSQKEGGAE